MNKELRDDLEHLIVCNDKSITQDLRDDVKMTLDYIDELENKINKALAYIERMTRIIDYDDDEFITWENIYDIDNILMGEDNE